MFLGLVLSACSVVEPAESSKINEVENNEEDKTEKDIEEVDMQININVNDHVLTATLVNNSSTAALIELLKEDDIVIDMRDYGSMEKVGMFPQNLPTNDEQISTDAGDLILYQGNAFVIYYDTNSWSFTRLGKINDVSKTELINILGSGNVRATLSLK